MIFQTYPNKYFFFHWGAKGREVKLNSLGEAGSFIAFSLQNFLTFTSNIEIKEMPKSEVIIGKLDLKPSNYQKSQYWTFKELMEYVMRRI